MRSLAGRTPHCPFPFAFAFGVDRTHDHVRGLIRRQSRGRLIGLLRE